MGDEWDAEDINIDDMEEEGAVSYTVFCVVIQKRNTHCFVHVPRFFFFFFAPNFFAFPHHYLNACTISPSPPLPSPHPQLRSRRMSTQKPIEMTIL